MNDQKPLGQERLAGRRKNRHVVMLSDEQERVLKARSSAENVTPARYLAETGTGNALRTEKLAAQELAGVRRLLASEMVALNQVAQKAHGGGWDPVGWREARDGIKWRNQVLTERWGWSE